jgi:hypothetical protein
MRLSKAVSGVWEVSMSRTIGVALSVNLAIAAAAPLLLTTPALAQNSDRDARSVAPIDGGRTPARRGNVYDHRQHQPTQAQEEALGIAPTSPSNRRRVEREVEEFLRETDRLDKEAEHLERGLSDGSTNRH